MIASRWCDVAASAGADRYPTLLLLLLLLLASPTLDGEGFKSITPPDFDEESLVLDWRSEAGVEDLGWKRDGLFPSGIFPDSFISAKEGTENALLFFIAIDGVKVQC